MEKLKLVNKLLQKGLSSCDNVLELQLSLKLLGFMPRNYRKQCDGIYGKTTELAVRAFQSYSGMSRGSYNIAPEISKCLLDDKWLKVPYVQDPDLENKKIRAILEKQKDFIIREYEVPFAFLMAIFWQETGLCHYDADGFLFIGCDFGVPFPEDYRSRGWGIGQYTFKHHPLKVDEFENVIDPLKNITYCIKLLKYKFHTIKDKVICHYSSTSDLYLSDCFNCLESAKRVRIICPQADYHPKAKVGYDNVPIDVGCSWEIAVMQYNGMGQNALAYRAEVMMKILGEEIR